MRPPRPWGTSFARGMLGWDRGGARRLVYRFRARSPELPMRPPPAVGNIICARNVGLGSRWCVQVGLSLSGEVARTTNAAAPGRGEHHLREECWVGIEVVRAGWFIVFGRGRPNYQCGRPGRGEHHLREECWVGIEVVRAGWFIVFGRGRPNYQCGRPRPWGTSFARGMLGWDRGGARRLVYRFRARSPELPMRPPRPWGTSFARGMLGWDRGASGKLKAASWKG